MDARKRASRNLAVFWLVLIGIPLLLLGSCATGLLKPCCTDPPSETAMPSR
jgi:hypothetical protein